MASGPTALGMPASHLPPGPTAFGASAVRLPSGPTGLGTSAAHLAAALRTAVRDPHPLAPGAPELPGRPPASDRSPDSEAEGVERPALSCPEEAAAAAGATPGYAEREWGDGSYPPLYCPETVRVDDDLGDQVNDALVAWAEETGIYADRLDAFRRTGFGRLAMLAHPDTDDPDRLLLAAQMNAAWWASDDYYADETELGATPIELPPRLALVMSAMDRPPPAGEFTGPLEEALRADPVLVALDSATAHLRRHATPSQVMRICTTTFQMYVSWTAYAAWRHSGSLPPAWRYLAARQHDSFYTSMTLIDIVGGYQLPADLFYEPHFHRALMQAGTAAVIVNDLHSVAREAADEQADNLVLRVAAEEKCTLREAIETCVRLHNRFVRDFQTSQERLAAVPSVELQRFLRGAQAWMGGGFEWHSTSSRYH
ncbi:family 2 encapsulin nanocompartment cargo protein terpene cyclase [Actinoallomurus acanthiterrae]